MTAEPVIRFDHRQAVGGFDRQSPRDQAPGRSSGRPCQTSGRTDFYSQFGVIGHPAHLRYLPRWVQPCLGPRVMHASLFQARVVESALQNLVDVLAL